MTVVHHVAQVAAPVRAEHGEGPLWDDRTGELLWVDQYRGEVRSARPDASGDLELIGRLTIGGAVGAVVPDVAGGWMVAGRDGFVHLSPDGAVDPVASVLAPDGVRRRMNDGKADAAGRFWAGSMAVDARAGAGSLYVLERGTVSTALAGVTISNGLAWAPGGDALYYVDTPTGELRRYRLTDGVIDGGGVVVVTAPASGGAFDGACIDVEGCLWVALWGAGAVHRYSPEGDLLATVAVDAPQVSSCAFGGPDLRTLYITTSQEGYDAAASAAHPRAGCVFRARPGVAGLPAEPYRG